MVFWSFIASTIAMVVVIAVDINQKKHGHSGR
jgi:hypothetical protein